MSVDYLLHLVHSYKHQHGDSQKRVRGALEEMGVSITSGLITTFMACIALFLTDMLWFQLFGCFVAMVIFSAFFVAMIGLMALLAEFGPSTVHEPPVEAESTPVGEKSLIELSSKNKTNNTNSPATSTTTNNNKTPMAPPSNLGERVPSFSSSPSLTSVHEGDENEDELPMLDIVGKKNDKNGTTL
jgi:predicted RND superfamily exporter protein